MPHPQAHIETQIARNWDVVLRVMTDRGLLLGSYDGARQPNIMTLGWGSLGVLWGQAVWTIMVRPNRYAWRCIEHRGCFSINVPGRNLSHACLTCGTASRLAAETLGDLGLTLEDASEISAPTVAQCPIVYECEVIHRSDVLPERVREEILDGVYMDAEYHRMYYGKIVASRRDADALERLI